MNVFRFFSWHGGSPSVAPPFSFSNIGRAIVRHGLPWLVPLLLVVVWQVASALGWINHRVLLSAAGGGQGRGGADGQR
ncbi:hypothetical protein [Paludibacterium denitrificans]|uniref:hypothetical protein n=1 Tax=Paludibacterium denitrificans TaxID=2675226 RepID=UPI001E2B1E0C|nr:hypothetical protein [Paludibacterium denitrificans]